MSDKKMIEDSPTQNPLRFLQKRKPKTHSVIRPLGMLNGGCTNQCIKLKIVECTVVNQKRTWKNAPTKMYPGR